MHGVVAALLAEIEQVWVGGLVHCGHFLGQHKLLLLRIVVFAVVFPANLALVDVGSQRVPDALRNEFNIGLIMWHRKMLAATYFPKGISTGAQEVDNRISRYADQRE